MKFKNVITVTGIIFIAIAGLFFVCIATNNLQLIIVNTSAMEPSVLPGKRIWCATFLSPKQNSVVVTKDQKRILRIVAIAGDEIEIKDGVLFLNDVPEQQLNRLKFSYKLRGIDLEDIKSEMENLHLSETDLLTFANPDTVYLFLTNDQFETLNKKTELKKNRSQYGIGDKNLFPFEAGKNWNNDFFGPYKIPENSFFVLGDNRHNAVDSRNFGTIKADHIMGVVLGK